MPLTLACFFLPLLEASGAQLNLSPTATQGLDLLYSGHPEQALDIFRGIEASQPDHPLGYLLEAEARWWQIYCETCSIKWNMIDAWPQPRRAADDSYLTLSEKVTVNASLLALFGVLVARLIEAPSLDEGLPPLPPKG